MFTTHNHVFIDYTCWIYKLQKICIYLFVEPESLSNTKNYTHY